MLAKNHALYIISNKCHFGVLFYKSWQFLGKRWIDPDKDYFYHSLSSMESDAIKMLSGIRKMST